MTIEGIFGLNFIFYLVIPLRKLWSILFSNFRVGRARKITNLIGLALS